MTSLKENELLTAEQTILWLDAYRQWMFEIWKNHPELRVEWEKINQIKNDLIND